MSIKQSLLLLIILVAVDLPVLQAQTTQATNATTSLTSANVVSERQTTNFAALKNSQNNPRLSAEMEVLLKYQEFLRKESDQSATQLNGLIQHTKDWIYIVGWWVGIMATMIAVAGFTAFREAKKYIQSKADEQLDKAVKEFREKTQTSFDARLKVLEDAYGQRQAKYLKLLRSYFSKLFEANPSLVKVCLGESLDNQCLDGKRVLWVDDDGVGIALFVELLSKHCGTIIEVVDSTEKALAKRLTDYELVITNLRRDPHDDAGIRLTDAIRQKSCEIPIIIFTKDTHARNYKDAIKKAGVNEVAINDTELFSMIAKLLLPTTPPPVEP